MADRSRLVAARHHDPVCQASMAHGERTPDLEAGFGPVIVYDQLRAGPD